MTTTDFDMDFDDQDDEARYEPAHVHRWFLTIEKKHENGMVLSFAFALCDFVGCAARLDWREIEAVLNRHVQPVPDPAGWGLGRKL